MCDAIREGKDSSSVKTILNAAAMAYTMGMVGEPVPKRLWRAFKAAQRLEEKSTQEWGSFEAVQIMAHQADSELEWCVVGLAVLSMLLGLKVGEAASINFHKLGVLTGTGLYDSKVHRAWITRTVSGVALKCMQFCAWIAQRRWNLDNTWLVHMRLPAHRTAPISGPGSGGAESDDVPIGTDASPVGIG